MSQVLNALIARGGTARPAEAFYAGVDQSQINRRRNALTEMEGQRLAMDQQTQARNMEVSRLNQQNAEIDRRLGPLSLAARAGNQQAQAELLGALRLDPGLINDPEAPRLWDSLARKYGNMPRQQNIPSSIIEWQEYSMMSPEEQRRYLEMKRSPHAYSIVQSPGIGVAAVSRDPNTPGQIVPVSSPEAEAQAEASRARQVEGAKQEAQILSPESRLNVKDKLTTIAVARAQLKRLRDIYDKNRNTWGLGPAGVVLPYSPGKKSFDAASDAFTSTVRKLTRTPGEGAMSDWEGQLAMSQVPSSEELESVIGQKIEQLEELLSVIDGGYKEMLSGRPVTIQPPQSSAPDGSFTTSSGAVVTPIPPSE